MARLKMPATAYEDIVRHTALACIISDLGSLIERHAKLLEFSAGHFLIFQKIK